MKENDKDNEETSTAIKNQNSKYIKVRARILIIFGIISIFTFFALQNSKILFSGSIYSTDGEYHYEMKADPFIPQSVLLVLGLFDILFGILALIKSHHSRLKLISIWIMLRAILFTIMALKTFNNIGFQLYWRHFFFQHVVIIGFLWALGSRSYYKSLELSLFEEFKIKQK